MDAVISATTRTGMTNAQGQSQQGTLINSDFQTFLLMLTTQMQNQDPLNPIESSDYAVQLATFSGVEQQVRTNALIEAMSAQMGLSGMAQMASWVGMEARVAAPVAFDGVPLTLYPEPSNGADQAVLVVLNAEGQEVMSAQVTVSHDPVTWAGTDANGAPLPSGVYTFRLENYSEGKLVETTAVEAYGRIEEVRNGTGGVALVMDGGGIVAPSDIKAVREPSTP
ncbi:flagellar hook capping FlgD N-terminal domain-containing protein [Defluviimonas sp. SAOS-178_SWC]|uniref:flagellar hook capping FlgD N-terminal domain-containing protein n=1 Tax=Defluviimonas sp. SAOS-178_SWC TaxID=3121287 RepID=UPI0032217B53